MPLASWGDFSKVVLKLKELRESDHLYISLSPPFSVDLRIDGRDLKEARKEFPDIDSDDLDRIKDELVLMILAILSEDEDVLIDAYINDDLGEASDDVDDDLDDLSPEGLQLAQEDLRQSLRKKIDYIKEHLISDELKHRFAIKLTSKAPVFTDLDWDTKIKVDDRRVPERPAVLRAYATIKFLYQSEFGALHYAPLDVQSSRAFGSVTLNFTEEDLDYMISVLRRVRECLGAIAIPAG